MGIAPLCKIKDREHPDKSMPSIRSRPEVTVRTGPKHECGERSEPFRKVRIGRDPELIGRMHCACADDPQAVTRAPAVKYKTMSVFLMLLGDDVSLGKTRYA